MQQLCANNMMTSAKAQELGCSENDLKCLCGNPNFMYGLRDCSRAVCDQSADTEKVIEFGMKLCQNAGVAISGGNGSGGASQSGADNGSTAQATTIYSTITNSDGSLTTSAVATSTITNGNSGNAGVVVTTYTTNGSQVVMTLTTMMTNPASTQSSGTTETGSGSTGGSSATHTQEPSGSQTTNTESSQTSTSKGFAVSPGTLGYAYNGLVLTAFLRRK